MRRLFAGNRYGDFTNNRRAWGTLSGYDAVGIDSFGGSRSFRARLRYEIVSNCRDEPKNKQDRVEDGVTAPAVPLVQEYHKVYSCEKTGKQRRHYCRPHRAPQVVILWLVEHELRIHPSSAKSEAGRDAIPNLLAR